MGLSTCNNKLSKCVTGESYLYDWLTQNNFISARK